MRRGFGIELVEACAGFLIAVGVGVVGDEAALFGEPDAALDETGAFLLEFLDCLLNCALLVFSFRC